MNVDEYPWVFRRDEVDSLEDEMDDLYESVWKHKKKSFEFAILQEQIDTQEQSDRELIIRLDELASSRQPEPQKSPQEHESQESWQKEWEILREHPLYQRARRWVSLIKPQVKRDYEKDDLWSGGCFRVYANLHLVPLKMLAALSEESYDDDVGNEVAKEEYRLALLYLNRIIESVDLIAFAKDQTCWMQDCRDGAVELRKAVVVALSLLNRRKSE